ncbi:DNA-directed DNA polymerase [Azorhizobium oxalatiphilum]|uniref:DNA-directed DNA polymerase n=2 Tax=Azorhizobium oxalatiphilum TaxID=980631 RepID=A0A917CHE1_9HYPH|nr:DNA-directed DNA polymerase [Azorhizobium oxalatiphilum]
MGEGRRYLALSFPLLPTDRLRRHGFALDAPLVLVEKARGAMRLVAADLMARRLGLLPGLALADARARVPELVAEEIDRHGDGRFLARLADACDRYSPMVAVEGDDALVLDITGCIHLFGGEAELAADAVQRLTGLGLHVRKAGAGTPEAALALARFHRGPVTDERAAVLGLPVAALGVPEETLRALRRAGLKTIGDLAVRPTAPLSARFGAGMAWALARLLGRADSRITPRRAPPALVFSRAFAEPIGHMAHVMHALGELAGQAAHELEARGKGGRRFAATLFRSDGDVRTLEVETGAPMRDPAVLMRLLEARIEALSDPIDPGFGFDLVRLAVPALEALDDAQLRLGEAQALEGSLSALVDRLSTRFGRGRIRRFLPRDTHVPEQAAQAVPAVAAAPARWAPPEAGEPPLRPLHLFSPPQPIDVLAEVPDGPPMRFRWRGGTHDVLRQEGPERIASEWWHDVRRIAPPRDYYRVEDKSGHRFWIFRDGAEMPPAPRWYLHGLFP